MVMAAKYLEDLDKAGTFMFTVSTHLALFILNASSLFVVGWIIGKIWLGVLQKLTPPTPTHDCADECAVTAVKEEV